MKRKPHTRTRSRQKRSAKLPAKNRFVKSPARKPKSKAINPGVHRAGFDISVTASGDEKAPTLAALIGAKGPLTRIARTVYWPKDWWQHLKQRFAPNWVLLRWPVRTDGVTFWEDVPATESTTTTTGSATKRVTLTASTSIEPGTLVAVDGKVVGQALESGMSDDKLPSRPGYARITPGSRIPPGSKRAIVKTEDTRSLVQKGWDGRDKSTMRDAPLIEDTVAREEFNYGWDLHFHNCPRPTE